MTESQFSRPLASGIVPRRLRPRRRTIPFFLVLVTVVLLGNAIVGERGLTALIRANDEFAAISTLITTLRAENDELREQVRELRENTRAIEAIARGELGLVEPGETLFIVRETLRVPAAPLGFDPAQASSPGH